MKLFRFLVLVGLVLFVHTAHATTYRLAQPCQETEFRSLVRGAVDGDIILIPSCTIQLTGAANEDGNFSGDLDIIHNITLQGNSAGESTIQNVGATDRVIHIFQGAQVTIRGLTIKKGYVHSGNGGGINVALGSRLVLENSVVRENSAGMHNVGIGIYSAGGLEVTNSSIEKNRMNIENSKSDQDGWPWVSGGGIYVDGSYARIVKSSIIYNTVGNFGGGIFVGNRATASIYQTTIGENWACAHDHDSPSEDERYGYGGGLYVAPGADSAMVNVTLAHNEACATGPGIDSDTAGGGFRSDGRLTLRNTLLSHNNHRRAPSSLDVAIGDYPIYPVSSCAGSYISLGNNLSFDHSCRNFSAALKDRVANTGIEGLVSIGSLTSYYPISADSSAIDAVEHEGFQCDFLDDQLSHGVRRVLSGRGVCDIGAYEYQGAQTCSTTP